MLLLETFIVASLNLDVGTRGITLRRIPVHHVVQSSNIYVIALICRMLRRTQLSHVKIDGTTRRRMNREPHTVMERKSAIAKDAPVTRRRRMGWMAVARKRALRGVRAPWKRPAL